MFAPPRALLIALLAVGCIVPEPPPDIRDQDKDGYEGWEDCDDLNIDVHPDAEELCDGQDQDCDGEVDEAGGPGWYQDQDGDGWGAGDPSQACVAGSGMTSRGQDCDDADDSANPGQAERCDEVDNDCDLEVDEDPEDGMVAWFDRDGDGYGSPGVTFRACALEEGMAANGDDCQDSDPGVHPGAGELCDDEDVDEDCDGLTDDADPDATGRVALYLDQDGDGVGGEATSTLACDASGGLLTVGGDCDDLDPTVLEPKIAFEDADGDGYGVQYLPVKACLGTDGVSGLFGDCAPEDPTRHPGAVETWYDGVDQDCDGASDYDRDQDGHEGEAWGGEDCDDVFASVSPDAGEIWYDGQDQDCDDWSDYDQDGDGYEIADFGGADCDDTDARALPGGTLVAFPGDWDCDGLEDLEGEVWTDDDSTWGMLGLAVAGVGDTDGDGLPDLMIGAQGSGSGAGAALLLGGPASGALTETLATFTPDVAGTRSLGEELVGVGDVDLDGYEDVAISAGTLPGGAADGGGVLLFEGPWEGSVLSSGAASTLYGDEPGAHLGRVAAVDLDGDGALELALGERHGGTRVDEGFVYLVAPESSGNAHDLASATIDGGDGMYLFGARVVSAGDTDGDGVEELAVSSRYDGDGAGGVWMIPGPLAGESEVSDIGHWIGGLNEGDWTGEGLDGAVDANADGYDDLLIGAPNHDQEDEEEVGVAWLLLGPMSSTDTVGFYVARYSGSEEMALLGSAVAFLGDRDGDGVEDVGVGAPDAGHALAMGGEVLVFSDALEGRFTADDADILLVGRESDQRLGVALDGPGDLDADGYTEVLAGGATYLGVGQVLLLRGAP